MIAAKHLPLVLAVIVLSSCRKQETGDEQSAGPPTRATSNRDGATAQREPGIPSRPAAPDLAGEDRRQVLDEFAYQWDSLRKETQGAALLERQRELAMTAVGELGGSGELLAFLDFLLTKGAGDLRQEIIDTAGSTIFAGPGAKESREWLLRLEDLKLKEQLCRQAGEAFVGVGFKEFFDRLGGEENHHCQAALLTGYCVTLAKTDPEGAVKVYKDLGYPQRIDNSGMAAVVAAFPPHTDFLKFATGIGNDSMTLARRSRTALLQNWAGVRPDEAAQYVLGNCKTVASPDQMGVVVSTWAQSAPDSAAAWLGRIGAGTAKDAGLAALSEHWRTMDPPKAFACAAGVSDVQKRIEVATAAFQEWAKSDQPAAEKAWYELFPSQ